MSYNEAAAYEEEAERMKVSVVARSDRGFMRQYQAAVTVESMKSRPVAGYKNQTWGQRRAAFLARHISQYNKKPTRRRWLAMVMWAYKAANPPA